MEPERNEAYRGTAATIPFRVLRIAEEGVQILERDGVRRFVENRLERNPTGIAHSVMVVILLIPLNDEPAIGLLANDTVIDIAAREQVIPEGRDLDSSGRHVRVWDPRI